MKNKKEAYLKGGLSAKLTGGSGITLIALIITIIVMLILAIVSIKIASDSGLFNKAESATDQTKIEQEKETLQSEVIDAYNYMDGTIDFSILNTSILSKKFTILDNNKYKGPSGTIFNVNNSGEITIQGKSNNIGKNIVKVGQLVYVISDEENKTATVYGDAGDIDYTQYSIYSGLPTATGELSILPEVQINQSTYTVINIGNQAFYNCNLLTKITIPDSITTIGREAFYNCTMLSNIIIPNSINEIGDFAFHNTPWLQDQKENGLLIVNNILLDGTSATGIVQIPNGVTKISMEAFINNTNITSIILPNTVTTLSFWTFKNCTAISEIIIPINVINVSFSTFSGWTSNQTIKVWWNEGEKPEGWQEYWSGPENPSGANLAKIEYGYSE